jgi:iron complex outermembrane receptor protein
VVDPNDGLLHYVNLDNVNANGVQVQVQRDWAWGLRLEGHYSYQNVYNAQTGMWLNNSPRNLGGAHVAVPILRDTIFAGLELQVSSAARTLGGTETDPFWLLNFTLYSQKLIKNVEFSASLYNLLNQEYGFPGGSEHVQLVIPQDGRSFRFKLTWKF